MPNVLDELKQNFSEYDQFAEWFSHGSYYNTTLELCQPWQLREALSFYIATPNVTDRIANIVQAVKTKSPLIYSPLTFIEQATLQRVLRDNNYELLAEDVLPNNTKDLKVSKITIAKQLKYNLVDRVLRYVHSINLEFLSNYKWVMAYLAAILYYQSWVMLGWSIVIGFLVWMFVDFARHEYMEHGYLTPKNKLTKYLVDSIIYFFVPSLYSEPATVVKCHNDHHRYWKTDKDEFNQRINNELIPGLLDYDLNLFGRPKDNENFKYFIEIKIATLLLLVLCFGLELVLFYLLIPTVVVSVLQFQHDWYLMKFGEKDRPWLFPVAFNQAWHLTHHKTFKRMPRAWSDIFNGPSWVKYINPQYYLARLLFNFTYI